MSTATAPIKQVITVRPDGSIEGLAFKNKGLNLQQFGRAKIERTSEIVFDEALQKWTIKFLHGTCAGQTARLAHAMRFECVAELAERCPGLTANDSADTTLAFDDYDRAVQIEVLLIQAARLAGLGDLIAPR